MKVELIYKNLVTIIFLFVASSSFSQIKDTEANLCKDIIRKSYAQQNGDKIDPNKGVSYSYSSEIILKDKSVEPVPITKSTIISGKGRVYLINSLVEMYQDDKDFIVVMHNIKQIVRSSSEEINSMNSNPIAISQIVDSVVSVSSISECKELTEKGVSYKYIKLDIPVELTNDLEAKSMAFWIDQKENMVVKTRIWYPRHHEIETLTNTFFNYKKNYKIESRPVYRRIFDQNGELLPKYKAYRLIDNRG